MDPNQINGGVIWNIVCAIFAMAAGIIAFFAKNHYADIDKRIEALEGAEKQFVQSIHQIAINQAKGEPLMGTIAELKAEIKELRSAVHDLRVSISRNSSHSHPPSK